MTKQQRITATPVLTQLKTCTTFLLTIHLRSFVKITFGTITYATWKEGKLIAKCTSPPLLPFKFKNAIKAIQERMLTNFKSEKFCRIL